MRESTCLRSSSALVPFPADSVGFATKFRKSGSVGICTKLQTVPKKIGAIFIITVYLTASANAVPEARSHSRTSSSQSLKPDSKPFSVVTIEFRRHPDLVHQSVLSILSVWRIHVVYQTPCSAPLDFLNRSDKSSDTAFSLINTNE